MNKAIILLSLVFISMLLAVFQSVDFNIAQYLMFGGFIIVIVLGHKAAFRHHDHGLLAQYTAPKVFWGMDVNSKELTWLFIGAGLSLGSICGFAIKVMLF